MPAYFSLTFELNKAHDAIGAFCETLIHSGLIFKSGYWGFEKDSFEDIIQWNQKKLDENFELEETEHHSHDYKQFVFDYFDFSEVRLFIMNNRKEPTFTFELIVPEDDLREYAEKENGKYSVQRNTKRMEQLKSLAKNIWIHSSVLAIQTSWECSSRPPVAEKIAAGMEPQAEPFCIFNASSLKNETNFIFENLERNGVLIEDITQWNY